MSQSKLAQLVQLRRAEFQRQMGQSYPQKDHYVESVRVNFFSVLERHIRNTRSVA
jgi:hypothetical protein